MNLNTIVVAMTDSKPKMGYAGPATSLPEKAKFKCMLTGIKRQEPCAGCKDTNTCVSSALQIKEQIVNVNEEKPVVKVDADGNVLKCAKGADAAECGYKAGAKVCGKCGAMASVLKKEEDDMELPGEEVEMPGEDMEEEAEEKGMGGMDRKKQRRMRHRQRLMTIGLKSEDIGDEDLFLCAESREVKSLSRANPCENCTGGCFSLDDSPDLLEVEAIAEDIIGGKAMYSSYSDKFDMFVVQVRRKDGRPIEAYFDGEGELDGWLRVPESEFYVKESPLVDIKTAVEAATSAIEGKALAIAVGLWEGEQAYIVEIDGVDGKSYDVAVSLSDGSIIGTDDIPLEVKRMYSTEEREGMADEGEALPDGSYPIKDVNDLKNAIQAYGRAKDKPAAMAHIKKRAKALGEEELIPAEWMDGEKSAVAEAETSTEEIQTTVDPDVEAALLELSLLEAKAELDAILGDN